MPDTSMALRPRLKFKNLQEVQQFRVRTKELRMQLKLEKTTKRCKRQVVECRGHSVSGGLLNIYCIPNAITLLHEEQNFELWIRVAMRMRAVCRAGSGWTGSANSRKKDPYIGGVKNTLIHIVACDTLTLEMWYLKEESLNGDIHMTSQQTKVRKAEMRHCIIYCSVIQHPVCDFTVWSEGPLKNFTGYRNILDEYGSHATTGTQT